MVRELFDAVGSGEPGAEQFCATFAVPRVELAWVQLMLGTVNLGYPYSDDPVARIKAAGLAPLPDMTLAAMKPGEYATLTHGPCSPRELSRFIDGLLVSLHRLSSTYPIDVSVQRL